MNLRRCIAPGVGCLLASVVLAACLPHSSDWTGAGPRVGVVGDSEVYIIEHDALGDTQHHLTDALVNSGYEVSTSDMIGASTHDLADLMGYTSYAGFPSPGTQIAAIDLGVNDLRLDPNTGERMSTIDQAEANYTAYLDALGKARVACVVLVELPETTQESLDQIGAQFNTYLANQASARGGVVMRWASIIAQHPDYVNSTNGIHETAIGKLAYTGALVNALNQCAQRIS
jgi:hypothetical protein